MKIKKIQATNFISYKTIEIDLPQDNNLFVITGANASGKSSFIEAIFWGLYGKSFRNSLDKHIPNFIEPKKAQICITSGNMKITRGKNPPLLEFEENSKITRDSKITETQKKLNDKLGASYKIFESVSFSNENSYGFLDSTLEEKRILVCNYLDVGGFFEFKKKIKEQRLAFEKSLAGFDFLLESIQGKKSPTIKALFSSCLDSKKSLEEQIELCKFWENAISESNLLYSRLYPFFEKIKERIDLYTKILFSEKIFVQINNDYSLHLNLDGKELGLRSLSTSQKKRVNIAVSLALKDFLRETSHINVDVLFFDEVAGFDKETNEKFVDLLRELSKRFQVFVITQDTDLQSKLSQAIMLHVSMVDGFSQVEMNR